MRYAIFHTSIATGGSEPMFINLFKYLVQQDPGCFLIINRNLYRIAQARGMELDKCKNILFLSRRKEWKMGFRPLDKILHWGEAAWYYIKWYYETLRFMRKHKIQLLYVTSIAELISLPLRWFHRVRVVAAALSNRKYRYLGWDPLVKFKMFAYKYYQRIDAISPIIARWVMTAGVPRKLVTVSPTSFVDYSKFKPLKKENLVTFCSRLEPYKGADLFVEAIPHILKKRKDVKFRLIGYGSMVPGLQRRMKQLGIETNVELGFAPNPNEIFGRSKVFCSLQRVDNYPSQSCLEAMACENAIVATNTGVTHRMVDKSVGFLIKLNPEELAERVLELLGNERMRAKLGGAARKKALTQFSTKTFAAHIKKLFTEVMR